MSSRNIISAHIGQMHSCHTRELWHWELKVRDAEGYFYVTPLHDRFGSNLLSHEEAQEAAEAHLDLNYQNWREELPK